MKSASTPPAIALHLPQPGPPKFVSASSQYVATATSSAITSFQLYPPQALAHWQPPEDYLITALKVSLDSEAIAVVIYCEGDSALVLLHPRTLDRIFRIALPSHTSYSSISFVSPPPSSKSATHSLLPPNLVELFTSLVDPSQVAQIPTNSAARFALLLSPTNPSQSPIIIVFHKGYKRIQQLNTLPKPRSLTAFSVPGLTTLSPELVFYDERTIQYLSVSGPHQIDSTFHVKKVIATVRSPSFAIVALVAHPADCICVAVYRDNSVTLTPITNPLPDVALIPTSQHQKFLLGTVTVNDIIIVAELLLRQHIIVEVIPRVKDPIPKTELPLNVCVVPTPINPLSVTLRNNTVTCRYPGNEIMANP